MIYTLTMNPSLDYHLFSSSPIERGKTNRAAKTFVRAGGKGINVSLALKKMGTESKAVVLCGGNNGAKLRLLLEEAGLDCVFVESNTETRVNVKLHEPNFADTEMNAAGGADAQMCADKVRKALLPIKSGDILVLAGSLPTGFTEDFYAALMRELPAGVRVAVDCAGEALRLAVKQKPFVIKPNLDELSALFKTDIFAQDAPEYAMRLANDGASSVLVSMGGEGAVLCIGGRTRGKSAPKGKVISTIGAGDAMLAGFLRSAASGAGEDECLRFAVAAGSAKAFSDGFAALETVEALYNSVE